MALFGMVVRLGGNSKKTIRVVWNEDGVTSSQLARLHSLLASTTGSINPGSPAHHPCYTFPSRTKRSNTYTITHSKMPKDILEKPYCTQRPSSTSIIVAAVRDCYRRIHGYMPPRCIVCLGFTMRKLVIFEEIFKVSKYRWLLVLSRHIAEDNVYWFETTLVGTSRS